MATVMETSFAQGILRLRLPRYESIPHIDLYKDQLVSYVEDILAPVYQPGEKIVTPSMVNNYVKQGLLPAPSPKKKYRRRHVATLIAICLLKQAFPVGEIGQLIGLGNHIDNFDERALYDYLCDMVEAACRSLFSEEPRIPEYIEGPTEGNDLMQSIVITASVAVASTLYVKASLVAWNEPSDPNVAEATS